MNKYLFYVKQLLMVIFLLPASADAGETYSFGVVPQFDSRHITTVWQPILKQVSRLSGVPLELKTSSSIPEFEKRFAEGGYDFAYMNPFHAIVARQQQGYEPLLRDVGRSLHGIIVVKKDSDITSVEELDGKVVAFPAPNSLGASLIPRAEFVKKFNIKIDETYVKSHSSVYLNVLLGKAAAGGGVQKTLSQQPEEVRNQLRILYKTTGVPPHPITVHPRVGKAAEGRVREAFIELGSAGEGRNLLKKIPIKSIGAASMDDYVPIQEMGLKEFYVDK